VNIQKRLEKLESEHAARTTGYCICRHKHSTFTIYETAEALAAEQKEPIYCGACGREIQRAVTTFKIDKPHDDFALNELGD
jgi:hypothetical protein